MYINLGSTEGVITQKEIGVTAADRVETRTNVIHFVSEVTTGNEVEVRARTSTYEVGESSNNSTHVVSDQIEMNEVYPHHIQKLERLETTQ